MNATVETPLRQSRAQRLTERLYGEDIFAGYEPELPLDLQGWNSHHPALAEALVAARPRYVVDVGVWKGASVAFLATQMAQLGLRGAVIAVDTFLGSPEHWNRNRPDGIYASLRMDRGQPMLYRQFLSNVAHLGLQASVVPMVQTSENAAMILGRMKLNPEMVHIDAAHEYEPVLRDARRFWEILAPGGVLVGDDWSWPGVARAAQDFAAEIGQELAISGPKWTLRKPLT
ncbi:class I SAM-dependent methyltransferase [Pseudoroseomonas globiformis]|uniref:Class I SAM-dependent methyltransferase n=1 Tax=Teichococcus globiformis TaxID=2307229 RepID=A0ABV7G602_9PROT